MVLSAYDSDTGQRFTLVHQQRKKADYAEFMYEVILTHYADSEQIDLIQDKGTGPQLNTHKYGSFYEHLPVEQARLLSHRLTYFTPKHGSWLNMAELGGRSHQIVGPGPLMFESPDW